MTHPALENLTDQQFLADVSVHSNPRILHSLLHRMDEVEELREALRRGEITENQIREFVASLLEELETGDLFPFSESLAAIAVALEGRATDFAEEYILDLARLDRIELKNAIGVAEEAAGCLANSSANLSKDIQLQSKAPPSTSIALVAENRVQTQDADHGSTSKHIGIS